ncbi:helix-turn-helix domain-containing protein [Streptomyces decoyicus]
MDSTGTPSPGANIAVLRRARDLSQAKVARLAGITVSHLSKVENGDRAATPPVVAALARAMGVTTARIYGEPFADPSEQSDLLTQLRGAVRRHTLPREDLLPPAELEARLKTAAELRAGTKYLQLLQILPTLLGQATASALAAGGDATAWGNVADVYGCAYAVAHRMNQPDLADLIVSRQTWAAQQTWNPVAEVGAAWNEAGTYQSAGDYGDGLAVVDQAITRFESGPIHGPDSAIALGSLHLRGIVLASRAKDKAATATHAEKAKALSADMRKDVLQHNLTFGPANLAFYELAAHVELEQPQEAVAAAEPFLREMPSELGPSRVGRFHIDTARAKLALSDHQGAEEALGKAFEVAPQMAQIHPMAREVLRVLFVSHQRARPGLLKMAKVSGLAR